MEKLEKLKRLLNLCNYALYKGVGDVFGADGPFVYLEVGRAALERLREDGADLIKATPLDTMNAVYGFFTEEFGYFEEAGAKEAEGEGEGVYELYEKRCLADEANSRALKGAGGYPACFCYNVMRYCMVAGFSLDFELVGYDLDPGSDEERLKLRLKRADFDSLMSLSLVEELKKGQAELRKVSEDFKGAIEMSLDAIVTDDESGRILLWNPAAERMFGYTKKEAMGLTTDALVPERYREAHRAGIKKFVATGESKVVGMVVEMEGLKKDGSVFPVEMSMTAKKAGGRWFFTAVIRDATERRRLEGELRGRLEEMERLNKLMVGRELKMAALREEVRTLRARLKEKE